ncbi:NUDIX hydrolase domain-like protein [Apiospora arundinis]|uniref:NUDIX hydrolase domain-like protein n=1 Tax=Apiospora arundinis TaxID=335852 RepID=A0ABR2J746_9PEZI
MSGQQGTTSSPNAVSLIVDSSLIAYQKWPATYKKVQELKGSTFIKHLVVSALVISYPSPSSSSSPQPPFPTTTTTPNSTTNTANIDGHGDDHPVPRVLLVQRALTDSCPGIWEAPGGTCDDKVDRTVVEAAARELAEETGLVARAALGCVGTEKVRGGWRTIVTFLMEIESPPQQQQQREQGSNAVATAVAAEEAVAEGPSPSLKSLNSAVILDPKEHGDFVWATEEEVRQDQAQGRHLKWRPGNGQKDRVLEGFRMAAEMRQKNWKP